MIQANYKVQNPHMTIGSSPGVVDGVEMTVMVDVFEVQLVAEDLSDGSITLRFKGPDVQGAKDLFTVDADIVVQFVKMSKEGEAPAAAAA